MSGILRFFVFEAAKPEANPPLVKVESPKKGGALLLPPPAANCTPTDPARLSLDGKVSLQLRRREGPRGQTQQYRGFQAPPPPPSLAFIRRNCYGVELARILAERVRVDDRKVLAQLPRFKAGDVFGGRLGSGCVQGAKGMLSSRR